VNPEHLKAFLWLRWRLRVNQFRKAGTVNAVLFSVFVVLCLVTSATLFVAGVLAGLYVFGSAPTYVHLIVWDGIVLATLLFWTTGLLADLQRAEALSLDRFLHLPVSPSGAFLVNYLSSLFSLTLVVFVPGAVGLLLGLAVSRGPLMLLGLPLLAAALFALTAVTYQFQGWLASLMANPRRRRTVVVLLTAGFVLLAQSPNLINVIRPWGSVTGIQAAQRVTDDEMRASHKATEDKMREAAKAASAGELPGDAYKARLDEISRDHKSRLDEINRRHVSRLTEMTAVKWEQFEPPVRLANLVLPPGWLPLGAEGLADGEVLPALLGMLGFTAIGSVSLRRAYGTTLGLYTGRYTAREQTPAAANPSASDPTRVRLIEWRLPWVSEYTSAVATAGFRSLTRAPEAKMALLTPLIMVVVFGGAIASGGNKPPDVLRPMMAYGAGGMVLLIAGMQLLANQFGFDRAGFRAFVLSPAPRRDILLGKNLAAAPLLLGLGLVAFLAYGAVYPMRADHYPAVLAQLLSTYLVLCAVFNALSILTPLPVAPGAFRPSGVKVGTVLLQVLASLFLPALVLPILVPYGVEVLLDQVGGVRGYPISLLLSAVMLAVVGLGYWWLIGRQGDWLAAREQRMVDALTSRAE
jgi:ABC-2 type transport system permease protein